MLPAAAGGCASQSALADSTAAEDALTTLADQQRAELTSYAALLRVKMLHEGRIEDFRAEIFADGDSLLSVYVRGFLGRSAFKALLRSDSLLVYFPSERKYYSGRRHDIETGELRDTRYIIDYLLTLLRGYVPLPDRDQWLNHVTTKKQMMHLTTDDRGGRCGLHIDLSTDRTGFPFQRLKSLELRSTNDRLRINMQAQSSHYNRQIPAEKYLIDLPATAVRLSEDELVEMLTGTSP